MPPSSASKRSNICSQRSTSSFACSMRIVELYSSRRRPRVSSFARSCLSAPQILCRILRRRLPLSIVEDKSIPLSQCTRTLAPGNVWIAASGSGELLKRVERLLEPVSGSRRSIGSDAVFDVQSSKSVASVCCMAGDRDIPLCFGLYRFQAISLCFTSNVYLLEIHTWKGRGEGGFGLVQSIVMKDCRYKNGRDGFGEMCCVLSCVL